MSTDQLSRVLSEHLDAVAAPPPDLAAVVRRGRATRRRRWSAGVAVTVGAVAAATFGFFQLAQEGAEVIRPGQEVAVPGGLDLSKGLRAVEDPGVRLHLGGTSVPLDGGSSYWLDTDGAASPRGVLYPDERGAVHLVGRDGRDVVLDADARVPQGWHPTIKVDPVADRAVWASQVDDGVRLTVHDLAASETVATYDVDCGGDCGDLVIDGIDGDAVFVRIDGVGTYLWTWGVDPGWEQVAGPDTRVADAKGRTVLHDGPAPTLPTGWRTVAGAVDAQLTHDGRHVLYWSDRLRPVDPAADRPIRLALPTAATFFAVDTDGSVLAATLGDATVYDCEIPAGPCERVVRLSGRGGDPSFPGTDM